MSFVFYNSLTKHKEPFNHPKDKKVTMYTCGPTVYGYAHIGNFATFLFADFLRRALELDGYTVEQTKNITDVGHLTQEDIDQGEDRIQKAAKAAGKTPQDIAKFFTEQYIKDEQALNILEPTHRPLASAYVQDVPQGKESMISFIQELLEKGVAYMTAAGNVYFDIAKFPEYGKLSGNTLAHLKDHVRAEIVEDPEKHQPQDFALWLVAKPEHLMQWDAEFTVAGTKRTVRGYPGWHIECSVMAADTLGEQIDIHTGGEDLKFPHHENEIAQSESKSGKPFAQFWMHRSHITIDGEKMSRSKNNFYTLENIKDEDYDPLVFRFMVFGTHYRKKMNFTWEALQDAKNSLNRMLEPYGIPLIDFLSKFELGFTFTEVRNNRTELPNKEYETLMEMRDQFMDALRDDLNTPKALSVVYQYKETVRKLSLKYFPTPLQGENILGLFFDVFDAEIDVFGKYFREQTSNNEISATSLINLQRIFEDMEQARLKKDYVHADELRAKIIALGGKILNKPDGTSELKKKL